MKSNTIAMVMAVVIAATAGTVAGQTAYAKTPTKTTTTAVKKKKKAKNALLEAKRSEQRSGSCDWLKVSITKKQLKKVTEPQFRKFCESVVKDSGYNWVTIVCEDGTGIEFYGSFAGSAEYGNIDSDGELDETLGYISLDDDGRYTYVDAADAD